MKVLVAFALVVGSISAAPAKLGHLDGDDHHHHHTEDAAFGASNLGVGLFPPAPRYNYPEPSIPFNLYEPPKEPSGLYGVPNIEPPKEPSGLYETPLDTEPSEPRTVITTTTTTQEPQVPDESVTSSTVLKPMKMPMPYSFDWGVEDIDSGNLFTHTEDSDDGVNVSGEYRVLLPDNRLQIVRFRSDPINGYQADVTYEQV
ncbi:uncharacterized protein LOC143036989 [Oratosquilla oratoria]|uniref:uncharacterized protein LOC143036989 n=1 Tax=Oratosquilla oratoria TaxID=337810 RepID=UPI003F771884